MREVDLRGADLNLLVVLNALLDERSVTRAATRLGMSQPAASRALARLRGLFSDALLVDGPGGYLLTARAEEMRPLLRNTLAGVSELLDGRAFDPMHATGPVRLLMLDLDHFKEVNDTHGHPVGDEVLKQLAPLLQKARRELDRVGRIGGEEFGILLPGADIDSARRLAERLRARVEGSPFETSAGRCHLTISIGLASLASHREAAKALLRRADMALYEAKRAGRNCVRGV
jgi:diguanylate cyclase (GGDEF)-like protein